MTGVRTFEKKGKIICKKSWALFLASSLCMYTYTYLLVRRLCHDSRYQSLHSKPTTLPHTSSFSPSHRIKDIRPPASTRTCLAFPFLFLLLRLFFLLEKILATEKTQEAPRSSPSAPSAATTSSTTSFISLYTSRTYYSSSPPTFGDTNCQTH